MRLSPLNTRSFNLDRDGTEYSDLDHSSRSLHSAITDSATERGNEIECEIGDKNRLIFFLSPLVPNVFGPLRERESKREAKKKGHLIEEILS